MHIRPRNCDVADKQCHPHLTVKVCFTSFFGLKHSVSIPVARRLSLSSFFSEPSSRWKSSELF